mmetsp:Transcript_1194/g.1942  ORF Transcript_1194/g.1942 Transcript_1194/m.1942 type:complete len:951 (-) Transcript_1194:160-3012(-)|eukprot:CAMPEP_0185034182 /NCGR_PEP_ID=MMETSP1103-20130426/23822_1 /TAXON_ID=36769 /ORGANISM="Paraphysomonas bandaiensis, Strain Caron Lab Isolate" /LENGTH=950 /DNA_ID=CAMNT_0027570727 /DNA_START=38 /DNA_END=2890 /DNA_ORIENTATION=-
MSNECIQVVVRMRPFNTKEKNEGRKGIVDMDMELNQVAIKNPDNVDAPPKVFTFDSVYDGSTQQRAFYEESCFGLIESVLEGFNGTIFAYGQTGCGKTFTMQGPNDPPEMRGVIPNSFSHIFDHVKASKDVEYLVRCSYLEIYNEVIRDLLGDQKNPLKCDLKEDPQKGIVVSNLCDVVVETEEDMDTMLNKGLANRTVGSTLMNAESSRSHSIFTIVVEMNNRDEQGKDHIRAGKLNLVDLAGSERQKKTGASGDRLKEGSKINLSLSALGNVISALSDGGGKHIPYRDSKLTRLLQDSLGGNTKTLMVAAMSPADYNYDETLSTLRYANRAKSIKNKPKINEDPKDAMIREFKEEIERLRQLLSQQNGGVAPAPTQAPAIAPAAAPPAEDGSPQEAQHKQQKAEVTADAANFASMARDSSQASNTLPEVDFASLAQGGNTKASPRSNRSSPRSGTKRSPREERVKVEKEIVEVKVEVEKVSEEQLHKQKRLEEYSQAVEEERDYFGEQLKEMHNEVEMERKKREEMAMRLQQLQSKLMGRALSIDVSAGESGEAIELVLPPNEKQLREQQEAENRLNERKAKARKKEEAKRKAEQDRKEKDRNEYERELQQTIGAQDDSVEKKISKIKKKFEKKLQAARSEIDDLHEEFELEREAMLENIREANKDAELFRQICLSLLDEKRLRQIVDKCQYDDDTDEWIVPYMRTRDAAEFRLPEIESARNHSDGENTRGGSARSSRSEMSAAEAKHSRRPGSRTSADVECVGDARERKSHRPNSHRGEQYGHVPSLNVPSHAPSKPPMPKSARRDKKKSKQPKEVPPDMQDMTYTQDEGGNGEQAGSIAEWGFAGDSLSGGGGGGGSTNSARDVSREATSTEVEFNAALALNHIGGPMGDRQSSRHGSRRSKNRSANGNRKSAHASGCVSDSATADKHFSVSCSPRSSDAVYFPQL